MSYHRVSDALQALASAVLPWWSGRLTANSKGWCHWRAVVAMRMGLSVAIHSSLVCFSWERRLWPREAKGLSEITQQMSAAQGT